MPVKRPHLLFFSARWHDCKPENGPSNAESILWGPFSTTGLGSFDCFLSDEEYLKTNEPCDAGLLRKCVEAKPDLLVLAWMPSAPDHLNPKLATLATIRHTLGIPIVAIWYDTWADWVPPLVDTITPIVNVSVIADSIDHFAGSPFKGRYLHLFHPADTRTFYDPELVRDIGISFNGGMNGLRDRIAGMNALAEAGLGALKFGGQQEHPLPLEEYARVFMRSRISLNFSLSGAKQTLKGRLLEATLCGSMLLETWNRETPRWFVPMLEYVPFFDEKDLVDKARYYLEHEAERATIAQNGREKARRIGNGKAFWGAILSEAQKSMSPGYSEPSIGGEFAAIVPPEAPPLVSVFNFCKNAEGTIRRSLDSLVQLFRCYPNLEIVIQDGASTDRTVEIVREYAAVFGERLKLVSEPDSCAGEGFLRAFKRCSGEIICSCLSDEELMPYSAVLAVEGFRNNPEAGALFGWICTTDENGRELGIDQGPPSFDVGGYLCGEFTPHFSASFFKKSSLEQIGFYSRDWSYALGEFEIWARLGLRFPIVPLPRVISRYARHGGSLSSGVKNIQAITTSRVQFVTDLFDSGDLPFRLTGLRARALAGQHIHAAWHYLAFEIDSPEEGRKAVLEALNHQPYPEHPLYPSFVTRLYEHGIGLCNSGEYERALDFLRLVKKTRIYVKNIFLHLAVAACAVGLNLEAEEAIEWELSVDPGNQEAIALREILKKRRAVEPLSRFELLSRAKNQAMEKFLSEKEVT